jgi:hypothetical protein
VANILCIPRTRTNSTISTKLNINEQGMRLLALCKCKTMELGRYNTLSFLAHLPKVM